MLDVQLDINRCTAESWSESLRTLELQKQFGNTTEAAVQQARANLLTVETNVLTLEQQVKKQENAISLLLGDVPSHIERGTLTEQQFPDTLSVGVPLQLLPSGRSIAGTGVLCHRCRPLRLLSQHYAGRVCRLDKQYRCRHYQSRTLATECSRLIDTPPLQPWA